MLSSLSLHTPKEGRGNPRPLPAGVTMTEPSGTLLVLIVDPDPDSRALLALFLEHAGYEVEQVSDADAAAALARRRVPAVIVGEHPVCAADGRPLCRILRADPVTAGVPFLAVTSRVTVLELDDAGRNHYSVVAKPADFAAVVRTIGDLLGSHCR
jgi:CheY-like chemotaxis protein